MKQVILRLSLPDEADGLTVCMYLRRIGEEWATDPDVSLIDRAYMAIKDDAGEQVGDMTVLYEDRDLGGPENFAALNTITLALQAVHPSRAPLGRPDAQRQIAANCGR